MLSLSPSLYEGSPPRVSCVQGEQRLQESIRVRSRRRSHRPTATSCALRPCATNAVCGHTDYQSVLVSVREKNQSEYNTELGSLEPQRPAGAFRSRSYRLQRATTHVDPGRRRVTDDNRPCAAAAAQLIAADTSTTPIRLATSHHKSVAELRF